mmetsp:Transcript_8963/g.13847  ORF Transcript_8963/g.13847 Transcript_8963/m.13847 type:complete len:311 (+) Transcript_8963:108-1040(+)
MMAAEGDNNNFVRYIYRGEVEEFIPLHVTHIIVREDVTVVLAAAFYRHPNIVEVICHDKVEEIEEDAFYHCPSLRRLIMPGVTIVGRDACYECAALTDVECAKLEIIGGDAFCRCTSLRSINLPSVRIVKMLAFDYCTDLVDVKFGNKLERIDRGGFVDCHSLERITIPLKDYIFTYDNIFRACDDLNHVHLVEGALLQETIAALLLEEWRNDMNEEVDSINQILPNTPAGDWDYGEGGKAQAIRVWIRSVLRKIVHYKAEHQRILDGAATTLQRAVPRDIMMNNVMPFLALPSHTFEGENGRPSRSIYW